MRRRAPWPAAAACRERPRRRSCCARVEDPEEALATLPAQAWFARPLDGGTEVLLRGAVLVRARGLADEPPDLARLSPDLAAALSEPAPRPARSLLDAARAAGRVAIAPLVLAVALLAAGTVAETALLRGSVDDSDVAPACWSSRRWRWRWPRSRR